MGEPMVAPESNSLRFEAPHRPAFVRILNEVGRRIEALGLNPFEIDESRITAAVEKQTGLHDFGEDLYRQPMRVLIDSFNSEARLNPLGRYFARGFVLAALRNRLQLQDWWTRHPEILDQPVVRPIVVIGLPRTGSTLLQNLLAQDLHNRSLLGWEASFPTPPPERETYLTDPRIRRVEMVSKVVDYLSPAARGLHPVGATMPTECVTLFANSFGNMDISGINWVPSYLDNWLASDLTPHYRYFKKQLQLLQWQNPRERWSLKTPAHLFALDSLLEVFPDACVVQTHRDPSRVIGSFCSLAATLYAIGSDEVDVDALGRAWCEVWAVGLDRTMAFRRKAGESDQFLDVHYRDLLADPVGTVHRIYDHFGLEMAKTADTHMRAFMVKNPQHKKGVHRYTLEQFGLAAADVERRYAEYCREYGVATGSG
ncbi:MAG: sulfotransferase [Actinobacteria bacterium]|nr:MAG: sulfotransferase [Actinomycetota bacterium]RIK08523.1 MAG: sulfotransferase [Acidobacteriota bacterium]